MFIIKNINEDLNQVYIYIYISSYKSQNPSPPPSPLQGWKSSEAQFVASHERERDWDKTNILACIGENIPHTH